MYILIQLVQSEVPKDFCLVAFAILIQCNAAMHWAFLIIASFFTTQWQTRGTGHCRLAIHTVTFGKVLAFFLSYVLWIVFLLSCKPWVSLPPHPPLHSVVKGQVLQTAWDLFAAEASAALSHPRPIFWIASYPNPAPFSCFLSLLFLFLFLMEKA